LRIIANAANIRPAVAGAARQLTPPNVSWATRWPAPKQSYVVHPANPRGRSDSWMPQPKPSPRFGHACPAGLSIAKSAEAANAGATQHSPKQRAQSARRTRRR
jgi:hypothetical protein